MSIEHLKDPDDRIPRILRFLELNDKLGRDYTIRNDDIAVLLRYLKCQERHIQRLQNDLEDATTQHDYKDAWA